MASYDPQIAIPVRAQNGGLCLSRGIGIHPDRVLDSFELIYVREGALGIAEEGREYTVISGQSLLLWPDRRHFGVKPYEAGLSYYWVHFTIKDATFVTEQAPAIPIHATIRRPEHLTDLFRRFLDDQETQELTELSGGLLVLLMIHEVCLSLPQGADASQFATAGRVLASRADAFITTHFHGALSTSAVADRLGCNPDYLSRVFQKTFGITITEAILRQRMKKARSLLRGTDLYLEQIANECGVENLAYFRRIFKRETGMTPIGFRKLYSRVHVNTE